MSASHPAAAPPRAGVRVSVDALSHAWGATAALDRLTCTLRPGTFTAVVGPSGCGKSTLVRLLAGLAHPTAGTITLHDVRGRRLAPDDLRRAGQIGWLAQRPALLPWLTARDNVALPGRIREADAGATVDDDVDALLQLVGLHGFGDHLPHELSGGMRQRVGLARTLALRAPLWLMDEPLAALDELTRERVARDVTRTWQAQRPTVVWVTHHLAEAVAMADRILVLSARPGRIVADLDLPSPRPRDVTSQAQQAIVRRARAAMASEGGQ